MHALFLAAFILATAGYAAEPDTLPRAPLGLKKRDDVVLRMTAGIGAGSFGIVGAGRVLVAPTNTAWRFGLQGTAMAEIALFISPNENLGALHMIAARELVASGSGSAMLFAGLGFASLERRGQLLASKDSESESLFCCTEYESIEENRPSVLLGGDIGASFRRMVGISLQVGAEVGASNSIYWMLQADVGSW
jgi:hypothetical protein